MTLNTPAIVNHIKRKPELQFLDDDYVEQAVSIVLVNNLDIKRQLEDADPKKVFKSRAFAKLQKEVRARLREIYGCFWIRGFHKREQLLKNLIDDPSIVNHEKILAVHRSTKERLPYYPRLYKQLFEITSTPESILDLGCGFNPFSYPFLGCEPTYHHQELAASDTSFIQRFKEGTGVKGESIAGDLIHLKELPQTDVTFLLKLLDTLESEERNSTLPLLDRLRRETKHLIISFPGESLSGRATIKMERRRWFLNWLENKPFKRLDLPNEHFYLVKS